MNLAIYVCKRGHEDNVYITPRGYKECRTCRNTACRKSFNPEKNRKVLDKLLFGGNREIAIQRDSEKCVICEMTRQEHKDKYNVDITVDHIDGRGSNTPIKLKNNSLSNLQTLCLKCHGAKDRKRVKEVNNQYTRRKVSNGNGL